MCFNDGIGSHGCEQCAECGGRGKAWYDLYLPADKQLVDAPDTTGASTSGGRARKRTIEPKGLDSQIHRVAAARHIQNKSGSYEALRGAMRRLELADEVSAYLLKAKYVEQRWGIPSELLQPIHLVNGRPKPNVKVAVLTLAQELAVLRGLGCLDRWMPSLLNLPNEIRVSEMDRDGATIRGMARALGISPEKVKKARRRAA
jgi:hypothetical protein